MTKAQRVRAERVAELYGRLWRLEEVREALTSPDYRGGVNVGLNVTHAGGIPPILFTGVEADHLVYGLIAETEAELADLL